MTKPEALERLIRDFPAEPRPKKTVAESFPNDECRVLQNLLGRRSWRQVSSPRYLEAAQVSAFLTYEGAVYFLPGFLSVLLEGESEESTWLEIFVSTCSSRLESRYRPLLTDRQLETIVQVMRLLAREYSSFEQYLPEDERTRERFW